MDDFIPFSKPTIGKEELEAVGEVFNSGWLTVGKKCKEFEEDLKSFTGTDNVAVLDSCTSALTLSMLAIRLFKFEQIEKPTALLPALTFIATANAAYHAGYDVKFCDVGWDGNIDQYYVNNSYDLIVPVHFAGQACDMQKLLKYSKGNILEDAAHAIGLRYDDYHIGSKNSDGACFSFYPTKNMTTVEGGAFISEDFNLVEKVRSLSLHGLNSTHVTRYERSSLSRPTATYPGYKSNMTDVEAAIGILQLKKLGYFLERRKQIANLYIDELKNYTRFLKLNGRDHVWHMFVILVEDRDGFVTKMKENGVGVGIHYNPIIPAHPFYEQLTGYQKGDFPVAEYISDHCVSLPLFPNLKDYEIQKIINLVKELS